MRQHHIYLALGIAVLIFLFPPRALARCAPANLDSVIPGFQARNISAVEALVKLGAQRNVCFGIEGVEAAKLTEPTDFDIGQTSLENAIRTIMGPRNVYRIEPHEGVVEIRSVTNAAPGIFDQVIPSWETTGGPVQDVSTSLFMRLAVELNPDIKGFAGSYRPGDRANTVGAISEHDKTVRELLDVIIANTAKGAAWIAQIPALKTTDLRLAERGPAWAIVEYEGPGFDYNRRLHLIATRLQY